MNHVDHTTYLNGIEIGMSQEAMEDCSASGPVDEAVDHWFTRVNVYATAEQIRNELKEYGAWDAEELQDDTQNLKRIVWIAASNIKDDLRENNAGCDKCGMNDRAPGSNFCQECLDSETK